MATTAPSLPITPASLRLAQGVTLFASSIASGMVFSFSGYIVPRLLEAPVPVMLAQWTRAYASGASTMPFLALGTASGYLWLALRGPAAGLPAGRLYLAASALTLGIVPYTLVVMRGTNNRLHELEKRANGQGVGVKGVEVEKDGEVVVQEEKGAKALVDWWAVLNLGRAALLAAGAACGFAATL